MQLKLSAKRADGKWWKFGSVRKSPKGYLQASFKKTPEFMEFINNSGEWVNFSAFEDESQKPQQQAANNYQAPLDDEIPF